MSRLFVYAPSILRTSAEWESLAERLKAEPECSGDEFKVWPATRSHGVGFLTRGRLKTFAKDLAARIEEWDLAANDDGHPFDQIVMVGNSVGALLVRWAWLYGSGAFPPAGPRPWAEKVERIVLIAGLNRGLDTRANLRWKTVLRKVVVSLAGPFPFAWKDALAGAPFVTDLRLRWIRYMTDHREMPEVVQMLGTRDDLVERDDSLDIEQFPRAAHVSVAGATHANILSLKAPDADDRYRLLRKYLIRPLVSEDYTDPPAAKQDNVQDVAFVMHGIRTGVWGWVPDMRDRLRQQDGWHVVTPTYRYFSALAFSIPTIRRRKVRWFLDQYSREFAERPTARFHFVGHSNGTYLLGRGLQAVQAVRFDRAYLAGSVLPADYPWMDRFDDGQVNWIRNDRAKRDFPVALLSTGLGGMMHDIGGGGFEGFSEFDDPRATQWAGYFPGGHGAPLASARLDNVALFVTRGDAPPPSDLMERAGWLEALSRASRVLVPAGLLLLVGLLFWASLSPLPIALLVAGVVVIAILLLAVL